MMTRMAVVAMLFGASLGMAASGVSAADESNSATSHPGATHRARWAPHHGRVFATKGHRFETVHSPGKIEVYVYNLDRTPLMLPASAGGDITIKLPDGTTTDVALKPEEEGGRSTGLVGMTDVLDKVKGSASLSVKLTGLGGSEDAASFEEAMPHKGSHTMKGNAPGARSTK